MRTCVTGGTGFIGGALVRRLLAEGAHVRALARPSARSQALEARGVEVVQGELADVAAIERAMNGVDTVYHTAAKVSGPGTRQEFFEANVNGTQRVLQACLRQGVQRTVYLSSIAVYGIVQAVQTIDESTPLDQEPEKRDFYAWSKISADKLALSFSAQNHLAILRPGVVYGPGRPLPLGLLAFRAARTNFVFGRSSLHFPLNYIENLIDAMIASARIGKPRVREYIVVDDEDLTLEQYHRAMSEADHSHTVFLPGWPVLLGGPVCGMPKNQIERALQDRHYSAKRIREETGWAPKVSLRASIEESLKRSG